MMAARYAEKALEPDCPYLQASVGDGSYLISSTKDEVLIRDLPEDSRREEKKKSALPDKIVPGGSVPLEGKKIAAVNVPCPPDALAVDVDGSYIMAGFVDIHVHGGGDSDFMDEDASAFPTIAKAHCAHGTTALCPTTTPAVTPHRRNSPSRRIKRATHHTVNAASSTHQHCIHPFQKAGVIGTERPVRFNFGKFVRLLQIFIHQRRTSGFPFAVTPSSKRS